MNRKKLLFFATRQFWPVAGGKDMTLFYNCKGLYEECGYDIYLMCFMDKNTDKESKLPEFIKEVRYVEIPPFGCQIKNIIKYTFGKLKWPFQISLYYSKKILSKFEKYYDEISPETVIIDMIRLSPYILPLKEKNVKKILIEDDLLSKRYERQISASHSGDVMGQYGQNVSCVIRKIINSNLLKNYILKKEIKLLDNYEKGCTSLFNYITFISYIETEEYNHKYTTDKAVTLTVGADIEYYSEKIEYKKEKNTLSIVANCATAANADSLEMICSKVLPYIRHKFDYRIAGKYTPELKNRLENVNVHFLGFVDDIRKFVKSTAVYLSPMAYGTGIKTKIIEAMAMGMPVITNSIGAEGLNVKSGQELFIIDDETEMARTIDMLFDDAKLCEKIGKNAQEFVKKNYSWKKVYQVFDKMGLK